MDAADALIAVARELALAGHLPATSGNVSVRTGEDDDTIWLTASGRDKGRLVRDDLLRVDLATGTVVGTAGRAEGGRPSAETGLHLQRYRAVPETGAVLHVHDRPGTALTMHDPSPVLRLAGYELLKALNGIGTHDAVVELPVFDNTQDIDALAADVEAATAAGRIVHGYLIRGHGLYAWGRDLPEATRHLQALLFLLEVELDRRRMGWTPPA